ncbi:MAG: tetratricopeptide repeat protein, partial [Dehalococcoidia bacterium]
MALIMRIRYSGLALVLAIVAACGGNGADPTATPDVSSPTPFIADIDLDLAAKLLAQGDPEDALAIYAAGAERGTEEEQRESLWALARIHSQQGDNSAAEKAIEALRDSGLESSEEGPALLLQGKVKFAQGDFDEAKDAFQDYIDGGSPATPYALIYLSQISRQQGDDETAIDQLGEALTADLPDGVVNESLLTLADLQDEAGHPDDALATLERAVESAPSANEEAEALWLLAETAERNGNRALAAESLQTLVNEYPASYRSLEALAIPTAEFTLRDRAMVLFRNRVNDQAEIAFISIVDQAGEGYAEAKYHLGVLSERYERWDDAIIHYDAATDSGQSPWYAAQATWDKGTVLERLGQTEEAIVAYAGVA